MSKSIALAIVLVLVSSGAMAETNGTSKGNAPKPSVAVGGTATPKSAPSIGGPSKGIVPKGGNLATPAPSSTVGGPTASMPTKAVNVVPSTPGTAGASTKPSTAAPKAGKVGGGNTS